jgi:hypothetical protein
MRVKVALEEERLFFDTHPVYSTMPETYFGTGVLTNKCSKILFTHIKTLLPEIQREIQSKIREIDERLEDLGQPLPSEEKDKVQLLWQKITEFVTQFKSSITGKYDERARHSKELVGGAKIKMLFYNLYKDFNNRQATSDYKDFDIEKAVIIHEGDTMPGFPSIDIFMYLIQP